MITRPLLIIVVLMVLLACAEMPLYSQDSPVRAVLDAGPAREKGLLFLPINVIDYYRGEYTVGENRLVVFYTEYRMDPFQSWSEYPCSARRLLLVEKDERFSIVYLVHDEDWQLFVKYPTEVPQKEICIFIDAFFRRFLYFRQVSKIGGVPPFPAILALQ